LEPGPKFVVADKDEEANVEDAGEEKALLEKILKNPEKASLLKSLAASL
jgi:hypothetical protein